MNIETMRSQFEEERSKWPQYLRPWTAVLPGLVYMPEGGFASGIGCMDEGVVKMSTSDRRPPMIRLAGAGIMLGSSPAISRNMTAQLVKDRQLTCISYHRDCGAGAAVASTGEDGDAIIKKFATSVAAKAGVEAVCAPLNRIPHYHKVVAHYYCGVPYAPHAADLPAGFVTSRFAVTPEYGKHELRLAIEIAFGEHGFGELFTLAEKYVVAVVASSRGERDVYVAEVEEVVASLTQRVRERVGIGTFVRAS